MSATTRAKLSRLMRARARRAFVAGYTVIEVIMAMSVLAVGATGVIAMQKATLVGNMRARNLAVANAVASTWVERLRRDGLSWVVKADGTNTIASTNWLNVVGQDFPTVAGDEGVWIRPTELVGEDISPQFDVLGQDTFTNAEAAFCTNIRLTQLMDKTIRAEVRVFWLRWHGAGYSVNNGTIGGADLCSNDPNYITQVSAARERYHFVYVTSGVIPNQI